MDNRRITLTLGATLRFGSLGFVYTGLAGSVAGCTFTRLLRPNVLIGAAGREAFVRDHHRHVGAQPNTGAF
jgi:hypothetical protein